MVVGDVVGLVGLTRLIIEDNQVRIVGFKLGHIAISIICFHCPGISR